MPTMTIETIRLFATFFLGIGGILLGLAGLLFRLPLPRQRWLRFGLVLTVLLALSAGAAALTQSPLPCLAAVGLVGTWAVFLAARSTWVGATSRKLLALAGTPEGRWGGVLMCSLAVTIWWVSQLQAVLAPGELPAQANANPAVVRDLRPLSYSPLLTDRGRVVPVYVNDAAEANPEAEEMRLIALYHLEGKVIRTGPADPRCDCHGWTFADGSYWLSGKDMDIILEDNNYKLVSQPQVGDLVVYRDEDGLIVHSGIVRVVGKQGEPILVESKWGDFSRFIHPAELPFYDAPCLFYHTDRAGGHSLRTHVL